MTASEYYARWRYKVIPDHVVGEILSKSWIDDAVPLLFLVLTLCIFGSLLPHFFTLRNFSDMGGQLGEVSLVTLGMTIVMLVAVSTSASGRILRYAISSRWR